jgi:hypothetical protein
MALLTPVPAVAGGLPRLVIGPPNNSAFRELFVHADQWRQARAMTGAILTASHNLRDFSDDDLRDWFQQMRRWGISLELEVAAIKEWGPTADDTFAAEEVVWDRVLRLGGDLASVAMDEPLGSARYLKKSDEYAVEQTARFVMLARRKYPGLKIGDVEPYPGFTAVEHLEWLATLQARIRAEGVAPLDFYRLDADWIAFTLAHRGSWHEAVMLGQSVRKIGVPFSLIYWASGYPQAKADGRANETIWYTEVLQEGADVAGVGGHPDQFVIESWIGTPVRTVPEDEPYSFTNSVLAFGTRFVGNGK